MEETNPREELYNQFKASLKEPMSERYFSEDELVEIFDYAGDVTDDYAQFEVLFCAARLYPESQALIDRKALFYLDTTVSDDNPESPTATAFVADNPRMTSPLMDIIRMEVNHPENPEEALNFFLDQYETLNDEEIIRLIDLACDMSAYSWITDNLEKIRKKTPYSPTLLYEVMNRASEAEDYETVVKVTEELIEAEPFSAGYWATLFRAHAKLDHKEEARTCFDYAKDLATSDEDTTCFLVDVIVECAPYLYEEGLAMVNDWLAKDPSNYRIFTARGLLLLQQQDFEDLEKDVLSFINKYGVNTQSLRHLFLLSYPGAGDILAKEFEKGNPVFTSADMDDLLDNLHMNCNYVGMNQLMSVLNKIMGERLPLPLAQYWIEALIGLDEEDKILEIFEQYSLEEKLGFLSFPPRGPAFWFSSLIGMARNATRIEDYVDLRMLHAQILEQIKKTPTPIKLTYMGLLRLVTDLINHPLDDREYWLHYDPFRLKEK